MAPQARAGLAAAPAPRPLPPPIARPQAQAARQARCSTFCCRPTTLIPAISRTAYYLRSRVRRKVASTLANSFRTSLADKISTPSPDARRRMSNCPPARRVKELLFVHVAIHAAGIASGTGRHPQAAGLKSRRPKTPPAEGRSVVGPRGTLPPGQTLLPAGRRRAVDLSPCERLGQDSEVGFRYI